MGRRFRTDVGRLFILLLLVLTVGAANASPAGASVVLNEINCEGTDWVELVNTSDRTPTCRAGC